MTWIPIASQVLNTLILLLLTYGLLRRHDRSVHVPVMIAAFVGDVVNVLVIELYARSHGPGAVEQGLDAMAGGGAVIARVHIWASTFCIVGYVVAVITGRKLLRGGSPSAKVRRAHKINAGIFILTRLTSYATSFWMSP